MNNKLKLVAYWITTAIVALEMLAGGVWDLTRNDFVSGVMTHLGYPLYVLTLIGIWKIPGALVLLAPKLPRLKEWAVAGCVFNYVGAAGSHAFAGDEFGAVVGPAVFTVLVLASWALRPPERRLNG